MQLLDFNKASFGNTKYGGSENKLCLILDNKKYMIKKPGYIPNLKTHLAGEYSNNIISEYLGSHIVSSLGLPTHKTHLGIYNGQNIVACEDFTPKGKKALSVTNFSNKLSLLIKLVEFQHINKYMTYII